MEYIFYIDPETKKRHMEEHAVSIEDIVEFFNETDFLYRKRSDKSYVAYGKLKSGRNLEVVYRKITPVKYFIITAYDIENRSIIQEIEERL